MNKAADHSVGPHDALLQLMLLQRLGLCDRLTLPSKSDVHSHEHAPKVLTVDFDWHAGAHAARHGSGRSGSHQGRGRCCSPGSGRQQGPVDGLGVQSVVQVPVSAHLLLEEAACCQEQARRPS